MMHTTNAANGQILNLMNQAVSCVTITCQLDAFQMDAARFQRAITVFEPGRDSATLSRSLFECRTKINHPRHQVANKYQMSHI